MERIDRRDQISFQSKSYILETVANEARLEILLEDEDTNNVWRGLYSAQYIEDITQKTGNFKRFPVFLRMLITALDSSSDSVSIDLLSYDDLERLKSKKKHKTFSKTSAFMATNPKIRAKKYLILTYSVEFDRVHYPLPLVFEDNSEVDNLQKTIHRLQAELNQLKHTQTPSEINDELLQENEMLKHQIIKLEHSLAITTGKFNSDIDKLIREKRAIEEERDRKQTEDYKKIKRLKSIRKELERDLDRVKREMDKIISKLERNSEERTEVKKARAKLDATIHELENSRRETERWKEEFERAEEVNKMYEAKITSLELELKMRDSPNSKKPRRSPSPRLTNLPLQSHRDSSKCPTPTVQETRITLPTQENLISYMQNDSRNRSISAWNASGKVSQFSPMYSDGHSDMYSISSTESSPNSEFNSDALEARIQKLHEVIQLARA